MFTAIATVVGIQWIFQHITEILIAATVIIFLIFFTRHRKKKALIMAQEAEKLKRQKEVQHLFEQQKREAEEIVRKNAEALAAKETAIQDAISASPGSEIYRSAVSQTAINVNRYNLSDFKLYSGDKYTTLDFETTGLSYENDHIVEVGACKVVNGEITARYHQYVDPCVPMPAEASVVNHITDQMLSGKPKIYEVLPGLLNFISDDTVVCHNAGFDIRFLSMACMRHRFVCPSNCFDSMDLIALWPELKSRKLSSFLSAAGIENENAHSAIGDAEALAKLMILSMQKPFRITVPSDFDFGYSSGHFTGTVDLVDNKLKGKKFVITGEIEGYEREDYEKMIASHGGKCTLKISTATDYLIVGLFKKLPDGYVSAKEEYAQKLISEGGKIKIISPEDVSDMISKEEL